MARKLLKTEKKMSCKGAGEKSHSLADKLSEGNIELKSGNDSVKLQPSEYVEFELEIEIQ
jgi:amphi-Trp domain-containing protein